MRRIKLTNNSLLEYKNGKWYKNGEPFTDYELKKYKYYDQQKKIYMQLTPFGTIPYTPYLNKLGEETLNKINKKAKLINKQSFLPNKIITLKTKGKMNLADVPVNMLDSIARNTGRSRTNIKTNLGLVGKESTFGGYSKVLGNAWKSYPINPNTLVNNFAYYVTPEEDYLQAVYKNVDTVGDTEKKAKYAYEHGLIKQRTKQYHNNILADAFARYADNPSKYNPGQSNYVKMVTNIGNEVWSDPQIQNWWKTSGRNQYNKGLKE